MKKIYSTLALVLAVFVFSYCQTKVGKIGDPKTNHLRLVLPGNTNGQIPVWNTTDSKYHPGTGSGIPINPKNFGAKMDFRTVQDGVMTASSTTLTSATANFCDNITTPCTGTATPDVGKVIGVMGAGTLPLRSNNTDYPQYKTFTIEDGVGNVWWYWVSSCASADWVGSPPHCTSGGVTGSNSPVPLNLTATDVTVAVSGNVFTYTTAGSIDFSVFHPGWLVNVGGYAITGNLGQKTVLTATSTVLTVADFGEQAEASGATVTFTGIPGPGITVTDGTATLTNGGRVFPYWAAGLSNGLFNVPWAMVRISGIDYMMHMTGLGTTANRPPNWTVTCPNLGNTCADGGATWTNAGVAALAPLLTTVASVTNGTTAVLTDPAVNTVANAYTHLATDDTTAMRNTVTAAAAATNNAGFILMPPGTMAVTDTISMGGLTATTLQCVSLEGQGGGGILGGTTPGSTIVSMGKLGAPTLRIQNCPDVKFSNLRVASLAGNAPAAGIDFRASPGPSIGAGSDILDNITIGQVTTTTAGNLDIGWGANVPSLAGAEAGRHYLTGILLDGNNGNNDRNHFSHIHESQNGIGIYTPNSQAVEEQVTSSQFNFGEEGFHVQGQWLAHNIELNGDVINIKLDNSAKIVCDQCTSEGSIRDIVCAQGNGAGGCSAVRSDGAFIWAETADHVAWDSTEAIPYDLRGAGTALTLTGNFVVNSSLGRTDLPLPSGFYDRFVVGVGVSSGSSANSTLNVTGGASLRTSQIFDGSSTGFPHAISICEGGSNYTNNCNNNLIGTTQGGNLNLAIRDQSTVRAGSFKGSKLTGAPGQPALTVVGTAGASAYYYKVTATSNGFETAPSVESAQITNAPSTLSLVNGVKLCFNQVLLADGYNVYRTADGGGINTEQKITPSPIPFDGLGNAACTAGKVGFVDQGLNAPSGVLPTVDTGTGSVSANLLIPTSYAVASLPACSASTIGAVALANNTTGCLDGVIPVGGGAVACPVNCDGTNWRALYNFPTPTPSPTPTPTKTPTPTPTP